MGCSRRSRTRRGDGRSLLFPSSGSSAGHSSTFLLLLRFAATEPDAVPPASESAFSLLKRHLVSRFPPLYHAYESPSLVGIGIILIFVLWPLLIWAPADFKLSHFVINTLRDVYKAVHDAFEDPAARRTRKRKVPPPMTQPPFAGVCFTNPCVEFGSLHSTSVLRP